MGTLLLYTDLIRTLEIFIFIRHYIFLGGKPMIFGDRKGGGGQTDVRFKFTKKILSTSLQMTSTSVGVKGEKTPWCSVVLFRFWNKTVKHTHNMLVMARVHPKKLPLPSV